MNNTPNPAGGMQPVQPTERILSLDVLRGFALLGVLIAYAFWNLGNPPQEQWSSFDLALERVFTILVDTKAYTLFAFMFGLGFAIQLTRATGRGADIVPVFRRRLLALLLIGLVHAFLLRNGDILVPYACMGFVLLAFRRASSRVLFVAGAVSLLWPYVARSLWEATGIPFPERPQGGGNYWSENAAWVKYWYLTAITNWPASLPMFFFGLHVGRSGYLAELSTHGRGLQRIQVLGLLAGAVMFLLRMVWVSTGAGGSPAWVARPVTGLLWTFHAWGLASCYAATVLRLMLNSDWRKRMAPVGAVGRMALSNYLLQAVLIVPFCLVFGMFDRVTPTIGVTIALAVWVIQVPFSVWWLRHFRFGPAEWVWRSLTYGRAQPMRM